VKFAGARVLVTGASSGIGAATAVAFAEAGATVGICARREDRLREVLERCRRSSTMACMWVVDLADLDCIAAFAGGAERDLGGVDVLVNNAGIPKRRSMAVITPEEVESVLRTNFLSVVHLTSALLPGMLARGEGHIVNVSSMGTRSAALNVGAYAASKAALELYTEGLHLDLVGTGVTAQLLVPGTTRTELGDERADNDPPHPVRNPSEPEDVAAALLALLRTDDFEGFVRDDHAETALAKRSDPNRFLAMVRDRLASR
jgi:short-subunit dehydrogenase